VSRLFFTGLNGGRSLGLKKPLFDINSRKYLAEAFSVRGLFGSLKLEEMIAQLLPVYFATYK
jgi:hypothetical protein